MLTSALKYLKLMFAKLQDHGEQQQRELVSLVFQCMEAKWQAVR